MQASMVSFLALVLLASSASAGSVKEHPIKKVVGLLEDLSKTVEDEGKAEAVSFSKFEYWCKNSVKSLDKAIAEEKMTISSLEDKIDAKTKEKKALEEHIKELEDEIAANEASAEKAK